MDELGRSTVARGDSCRRIGAYVDISSSHDLFALFVYNRLPTLYSWTDDEIKWARDDGVGDMAFRPSPEKDEKAWSTYLSQQDTGIESRSGLLPKPLCGKMHARSLHLKADKHPFCRISSRNQFGPEGQ